MTVRNKRKPKPDWLKVKLVGGEESASIRKTIRTLSLNTVCAEASCPNMAHCFSCGTATFMILGKKCTRNCQFCNVEHGTPHELDKSEPERLSEAVQKMGLKYVVITSVTRDDLEDGGASVFAKTINALRKKDEKIKIEVLIPDFKGKKELLKIVLNAKPDVLNHNLETVPRLSGEIRPQADYDRSLKVLSNARNINPDILTKSGLMLGLGEKYDEIISAMKDLRKVDCNILTLGQYLQPSKNNIPVHEYIEPEIFDKLKEAGLEMGFKYVASGPLVRSSFHSAEAFESIVSGRIAQSKSFLC